MTGRTINTPYSVFLTGTRCKKIENHWFTPSQDSFAAVKKWRFSTQTESNTSFSFNWITVSIILAAGYLTSTCCPEVYAICCHSCYSMSIFNTFSWDVVLTPPRHCCIITTYITLGPPSPITSFITRTSVSSTTSVHTFSQTGNSHKVTCCFFAMFMPDWELTVYDECQNSFDIVIELWHMEKTNVCSEW